MRESIFPGVVDDDLVVVAEPHHADLGTRAPVLEGEPHEALVDQRRKFNGLPRRLACDPQPGATVDTRDRRA